MYNKRDVESLNIPPMVTIINYKSETYIDKIIIFLNEKTKNQKTHVPFLLNVLIHSQHLGSPK